MRARVGCPSDTRPLILRIQVECLMTSVIAFVVTVNWLRCEANCQTLLAGDDSNLSEKRRVKECKHIDRKQSGRSYIPGKPFTHVQ